MRLAALAAFAFFLHGYHLGVDDGEIYLPSARKLLNPHLYPFAPEFFMHHAKLSYFSNVLAWTASLCHISLEWSVLLWYLFTLFATLLAAWALLTACFDSPRAVWTSLLLFASVLTMPATNTGLLLVDPNLTSRSFTTPATLFALALLVRKRYAFALLAIAITALFNPQMDVYIVFLAGLMIMFERIQTKAPRPVATVASIAFLLPNGFQLAPATGPYREALYSRDYFFLANWAWYHWLGMLAPLAILAWLWRTKLRNTRPALQSLSFVMIPFGLLSIAAALVLGSSHAFDMFARLQPLRTFHLITLVFMLLLGGLLGEYVGARSKWLLAAVVLPAAAGMYFVDASIYPASPHIEWPGAATHNAWIDTLEWIRTNTPENAVFAVDSRYFMEPGVDTHGFRALSERSALADYYKDSGVVSLFPALAPEWKQMSDATHGLNQFSLADFHKLQSEYPMVSWTLIRGNAPAGLACPYVQEGYSVCRLPETPQNTAARAASPSQNAQHCPRAFMRPLYLFCQNQSGMS